VVDARKERLDAKKVWDLLHKAKAITTAKGKKIHRWNPSVDDKATILQHVIGPSDSTQNYTKHGWQKNKSRLGIK
jgi:hypothetical protein